MNVVLIWGETVRIFNDGEDYTRDQIGAGPRAGSIFGWTGGAQREKNNLDRSEIEPNEVDSPEISQFFSFTFKTRVCMVHLL